MNWDAEDITRAKKVISIIRNPQATDNDALTLVVSLMDIAETTGRINGVAEFKVLIAGGKQ